MLSDRCKCTLAAGSLITVTRSCGICTRFPFTLSRAPEGSAARQTMKGTCCFIFSFRFIVSHCIQKRKVLFVCSAEFFRPSWASLQPPVQNLTQAFHIQRLGGMLVHTGGFGRLHILGAKALAVMATMAPARHRLWAKNGWPQGAFLYFVGLQL